MSTDYRELDKRASEIRAECEAVLAKGNEMTAEDRDLVMQRTGEYQTLERLAVELRDSEIETMRAQIARGSAGTLDANGTTPEDQAAADAFRAFVKTGEQRAALVAGTGANGGFVVPEPIHAPLIEKYRRHSPIIQDCTVFEMQGNTSMYLPYKSAHGTIASTTETGARAEQTEPTFTGGADTQLQAFDYYTDQRATQQLLDDVPDFEATLLEWCYEDFMEQINADACVGAGAASQALAGIFAATATYATFLSGAAGAIANTAFLTQFFKLPFKFRPNAKWYMNPATLAVAMGFAWPNLQNTPLVQPNASDGTFSILGHPVVEVDDAPTIGATKYPVAFGDLAQGYAVGIHKQPTILRDPFTDKPRVIFYGLARFGGIPWNPGAVVLQKSNDA
jgi:HK97 family phage major capsid protein